MTELDCSVIIPVFNGEKTLTRLFQSIGKSQNANIEIILVDDGSTDGSLEVCHRQADQDSRYVIIHKPNGGVSSARNKGLSVAKGRYVFFIDADDVIHFDVLEKMIAIMNGHNLDLVIADFIDYNILNRRTTEFKCNIPVNSLLGSDYVLNELFKRFYVDDTEGLNNIWNKLFKLEIIRANDLKFDESRTHGEDWKFVIDYLYFTKRLMAIPDVIIDYMIDGSQIATKYRKGYIKSVTESILIKEKILNVGIFDISKNDRLRYRLEQFIGILKFLKFDLTEGELHILKKDRQLKKLARETLFMPRDIITHAQMSRSIYIVAAAIYLGYISLAKRLTNNVL